MSIVESLGIDVLRDRPVLVYEIMTKNLGGATGFMAWTAAQEFGCSDLDELFINGDQVFSFRIFPHRDTDSLQIQQAARRYGAIVDEVGCRLTPVQDAKS
jgi:hypothetical protein